MIDTFVWLPTVLPYVVPVALLLFACSLWSYYIESTKDPSVDLPLPPGTVGFPFVGETFNMLFKGFDFYRERRNKYGHVYKTHVLGKPTIRVWGNENIKKVLKNEETLVTTAWPASVLRLLGTGGLLSSSRRIHSNRRSVMLKAFTNNAIKGYCGGMEDIITNTIRQWTEKGYVMAEKESEKLAFRATATMLLGCDFSEEQMEKMNRCMNIIRDNFFCLTIDLPGFGFHKGMKARKEMLAVLGDIITQNHHTQTDRTDAVSILMNEVTAGNLTMVELKDSIIEMLFSAYHAMTSLCCSTLMEISRHPEVLDKLVDELQKHDLLDGGRLSPEGMSKMNYVQAVCKELLRFAPPYGGGFRTVLKTFELEGYQIPKGWTVLYSIRCQHESNENFTNARTFDPDRWLKEPTNEAFGPFGGNGIRSCIGERYMWLFVQLFVCQTVRGCQWELEEPDTKTTYFPVQMPTNGLPVNFTSAYRKAQTS